MTMVKQGRRSGRQAVSLLEMIAVVTILAIIASVIVPRVSFHAHDAKKKACYHYRADLNGAIEKYLFDNGAAPNQLSDLEFSQYYPEAIPKCPADNTTYTIDAATSRISGHKH